MTRKEEILETISCGFMLCLMAAGFWWLFVVQASARTDMLMDTHDCFVARQCEHMVKWDGNLTEEGQTCWNECVKEVR